jgi:hypothetical protein
MRNIIKETLDDFKFEKNRKLILSLLNETILPKYKWICKFGVEPLSSSNKDSIMIVVYLKPIWGHQMSSDNKDKAVDDIWAQVFEWIGIATYVKCVTIDHCDRENLTESRRDRVMTDYFNDLFNVAEMNWRHPIEYYENGEGNYEGEEYEDTTRTKFYIGSEFDDDVVFYYYDEHYFTPDSGMQDKSPLMVVEDKYKIKLDGYFGEKWHEPFKKWFKENFGLEIKTIDTD